MQFINKNHPQNGGKGKSIINSFIERCWNIRLSRYKRLDYKTLRKNKKFTDFLLITEQKGFCCYCMRKISSDGLTLEHIIPQNIKTDLEDELSFYEKYIPLSQVEYQTRINPKIRLTPPPYPHCIAYENLTASCNGRIYEEGDKFRLHACCNNKRKTDKIIPLFFLPRIHSILIYEEDGRLTYTEEYDSTIKSLNLDCDSLRLIRKVWARIRRKNIKMDDVKTAKNDENLRIDIIVQLQLDRNEERNIKNDVYWELLLEFYWFYQYFSLQYLSKYLK